MAKQGIMHSKHVWGLLVLVFSWFFASFSPLSAHATLSPRDQETYKAAFRAFEHNQFKQALEIASKASDESLKNALKVLIFDHSKAKVKFSELAEFIEKNPDFPVTNRMHLRGEDLMPSTLGVEEVLEWFHHLPPRTARAKEIYADALLTTGQQSLATEVIKSLWLDHTFEAASEKRILSKYKDFITPEDQITRLDNLLWDHATLSAQRQMKRVSADYRKAAEARIALYRRAGNVEALLKQVPESLKKSEGVVLERITWRRRHKLDEGARELLREQPSVITQSERWWRERHYQIRELLEAKKYKEAYELARHHGQPAGEEMAQAEFMAGWLAFTFLNKVEQAEGHFETLYNNVSTPISLSRGAYWAGRAHSRLGNKNEALEWFRKARLYPTTFYGQLAHYEMTKNPSLDLVQKLPVNREEMTRFQSNPVVRAIENLELIGKTQHADIFVNHLTRNSKYSAGERALASALAQKIERLDLAVMSSRRLSWEDVQLVQTGFPVIALEGEKQKVEKALMNAIIRQESSFDVDAKSHAGARGLMQLLPSTAQKMAKKTRTKYSRAKLTEDGLYNATLGQAYLEYLFDQFDGSYVLALAAYNAGPSRVNQWIKTYGDPRKPETDVVTWIEQIPFSETRNYVQRVLENLSIYRTKLQDHPFNQQELATLVLKDPSQNPLHVWNSHVNDLVWTKRN